MVEIVSDWLCEPVAKLASVATIMNNLIYLSPSTMRARKARNQVARGSRRVEAPLHAVENRSYTLSKCHSAQWSLRPSANTSRRSCEVQASNAMIVFPGFFGSLWNSIWRDAARG
jgi:hypothetical protein